MPWRVKDGLLLPNSTSMSMQAPNKRRNGLCFGVNCFYANYHCSAEDVLCM